MMFCALHSGELQNPSNIDECPFCMNGRQLRGAHNRAEEALREAVRLLGVFEILAEGRLHGACADCGWLTPEHADSCELKVFLDRYDPDRGR
jgi:hypothetical protein